MQADQQPQVKRGISRNTWLMIGFLAIAAFFVFDEHRAHVIEYLPFLLVLACPLMHLLHRHGGHSAHGAHGRETQEGRRPRVDERAVGPPKQRSDVSE